MATQTSTTKKSNPLPIIFILVTLGILGAGGYLVYTTISSNPSSQLKGLQNVTQLAVGNGMQKATEADFSFVEDPLVKKHFVAQANTYSYKTVSSSDGRGDEEETIVTVDYKNVNDIRFQMTSRSQTKIVSDLITLGDTTYMKDLSDNSWWVQKVKPEDLSNTSDSNESLYKAPEDFKDMYTKETNSIYTKLGEEACGNLTCYKYQEKGGNEGTRTFWFDTKSFLLRKEIHSYGEFNATTTYTYDGISIKAPSPTKNVPEGKSIYEMMASNMMGGMDNIENTQLNKMMPSQDEINRMMNDVGNQQTPDTMDDSY